MHAMDSPKPVLPVALADERLGAGWRRPRTAIRIVAVLCSLLAAATVLGLFSSFRATEGETKPQRQLVATIDMGIANRVLATEQGQAQARLDVEAGALKLQVVGLAEPPTKTDIARAERLKRLYGIVWVHNGDADTLQSQAYARGYNRVVKAEIERRHGKAFLDRLMREEEAGSAKQDKAVAP